MPRHLGRESPHIEPIAALVCLLVICAVQAASTTLAQAQAPLDPAHPCEAGFLSLLGPVAQTECLIDGREVTFRTDSEGDGVWDQQVVTVYDDYGYPETSQLLNGDGVAIWCQRSHYDRHGRLRRERIDVDCDNSTDSRQINTYTSEGYPLTERYSGREGDGVSEVRYEYDEAGSRTTVVYEYEPVQDYPNTTCNYEPPCPAPFDNCWQVELCFETAVGPPRQMGDGPIDEAALSGTSACPVHPKCEGVDSECHCDALGRIVHRLMDEDGDGVADEIRSWTWEADGSFTEEIDLGANGSVDVGNGFDADGLVVLSWRADDGNSVDHVETRYIRDERGLPVSEETRRQEAIIRYVRYLYDARGNLVTEERDDWGDGILDWRREAEWAGGLLTRETWDCDADGQIDAEAGYTYDVMGALLETSGRPGFHCSSLEYRHQDPPLDTSVDFPNRIWGP